MTLTDDLTDADAALLARADWREDPSLTGKQLADRYGRSPRWGQKQRAAALAESAGDTTSPVPRHDPVERGRGTPPAPENVPRTAPPKSRPATRRGTGTPVPLRVGQLAGFVVVATVCAVLSYNHVRDLAVLVGLDNASWVPLGIDGLMVVTTCSLMIDKRAGRSSPLAARVGLGLGVVGTLTANALAVNPDLNFDSWSIVRMVLAIYPPVTLAVVLHLVFLRQAGER